MQLPCSKMGDPRFCDTACTSEIDRPSRFDSTIPVTTVKLVFSEGRLHQLIIRIGLLYHHTVKMRLLATFYRTVPNFLPMYY